MDAIYPFLMTALGYILAAVAQSKTAENAKEELLGRFWQWIRPYLIGGVPELEETPEAPATTAKLHDQLLALVQDEEFFQQLVKRVNELQQAGLKEKNIVKKDIRRVKKIRIGDKEYAPNDQFTRKNIVEGSVEDADEFVLGDGQ